DVVEAEALGGRTRELVRAQRARLEEDLLGRVAGRAPLLHGAFHALLREEPELHHHVGDEARGAAAPAGGSDAAPALAVAVAGPFVRDDELRRVGCAVRSRILDEVVE